MEAPKLHNQCFPICIHAVGTQYHHGYHFSSSCIHIPISRLLLSVLPFHGKPLWILISGSLHAAGFVVLRRIALSFRRRIYSGRNRGFLCILPVGSIQPRCDIILTVRVVISQTVYCRIHLLQKTSPVRGCTSMLQTHFYHAAAQALDFRIICCAFCPTVPTVSIVIAIRISPAVFLVVLHIIRIQII